MDVVHLTEAIDKLNAETVPLLQKLLKDVVSDLNAIVSRLDGATIVLSKPKEIKDENPYIDPGTGFTSPPVT
jgi:hypothetical protein